MLGAENSNNSTLLDTKVIVAKLEDIQVLFEPELVSEIFLTEFAQVLPLPFYNPAMLGCTYQRGKIVPLVSLHQYLGLPGVMKKQRLAVIRLGEKAAEAAGIGIVVEKIIGSQSKEKTLMKLEENQLSTKNRLVFKTEMLKSQLWQPNR